MRYNKIFIFLEIIFAGIIIFLSATIFINSEKQKTKRISVIVSDSSDAKWDALKGGFSDAVKGENIDVVFVNTPEIVSAWQEKKLIDTEIQRGAKGIILEPAPGENTGEMLDLYKGEIPLIMVTDNTIDNTSVKSVKCDNEELGKALADAILNDYNGNVEGKKIGIMRGRDNTAACRDRLAGFISEINRRDFEWNVSDLDIKGLGSDFGSLSSADIVVCLDTYSLEEAGENVSRSRFSGAVIYGLANSEKASYLVDKNNVKRLIVPDEWSMAYNSMKEMIECIRKPYAKFTDYRATYLSVDRNNLFSDENTMKLFLTD